MGSHRETYIIVGAGIFGTSTALSLQRAKPGAIITLLDQTPFPNPSSASHDLNKIVRAGYADMFSMRLALEAVHFWRNDPFYQKFYHETGMAFIEKKGTGRAIIKNYKALNAASKAEILTLKDARGRFGGVFKDANWEGAEEFFWDPMSGWGEGEALEAVFKTAIARGVRYRKATVTRLMINANGACTGVRTKNDELLIADHVILCTGANTAKLLADTAPTNKNLQVSGRLVAAGAVSCKARVAPENIAHFKKAPVFYNGLVHTHGKHIWKYLSELVLMKLAW
jgi:sarcosine oxidase / L-pipecolate oxidase